MTGRGKYVRTPEIRERNSLHGGMPCIEGCTCNKHRPNHNPQPCPPNCVCGKHVHTREHNTLIGAGVARSARARRYA